MNPNAPPQAGVRRALPALGLFALLTSALVGGNVLGLRERLLGSETPKSRPAAVSRASEAPDGSSVTALPQETPLRSQPWWQAVGTLDGQGSTTMPAFTIDSGAIQWRVKWTCQSGRLTVRAPGQGRTVVDDDCPGTDTGYGTRTGRVSLHVDADGPWQLRVEQQVDVPLHEPPLPATGEPGTIIVATGSFYRIDQVGMGSVTIYRLADGTHALRLDNGFFVTANTDLELQLSMAESPRSTEQVRDDRSRTIAALDVTAGSLNFIVPPELDPTKYRSLVIWCERTRNAYAAASLRPA